MDYILVGFSVAAFLSGVFLYGPGYLEYRDDRDELGMLMTIMCIFCHWVALGAMPLVLAFGP